MAEEQPVGQRKEQEVDECLLVEPVTIRAVQATEPVHWLTRLLGQIRKAVDDGAPQAGSEVLDDVTIVGREEQAVELTSLEFPQNGFVLGSHVGVADMNRWISRPHLADSSDDLIGNGVVQSYSGQGEQRIVAAAE